DCQYEFNNHAVHDLSFRSQANGSVIYNSKFPVYLGSHCPGTSDDHAPVHYAQLGPDSELFNKTYIDPDAAFKRIKLDYNNWKSQPTVWKRRFSEPTLPLRK
ncbi:MAG: hypothetical protein NTU97_02370, partial [Candidatus Magasanikbacteria bacterium]|nr:hypothetical protein [Candidatus Magasanikbacteria bacterium]